MAPAHYRVPSYIHVWFDARIIDNLVFSCLFRLYYDFMNKRRNDTSYWVSYQCKVSKGMNASAKQTKGQKVRANEQAMTRPRSTSELKLYALITWFQTCPSHSALWVKPVWNRHIRFMNISSSISFPWAFELVSEQVSERAHALETASKASSAEQANEWLERANGRTEGQMAPVLYASISDAFYPMCSAMDMYMESNKGPRNWYRRLTERDKIK